MNTTGRCSILEASLRKWIPITKSNEDLEHFERELNSIRNADRSDYSPEEELFEMQVYQFRYTSRLSFSSLTRQEQDGIFLEEKERHTDILLAARGPISEEDENAFIDRVSSIAGDPKFRDILHLIRSTF